MNIKVNEDFIRKFMKVNNIKSIRKLAEEIGISAATLSRIFNEKRNPGQQVIGKMLGYFEVKFETLFSYENQLTNVNIDDHKNRKVVS